MRVSSEHIKTLQRRVDFLKSREHQNSFDLAELGSLEWAIINLQPQRRPLTDKQILADETLRYYFGQNGGAGPVSKQGRKVVDAIEAAHGIKETEK
jgi:hypothetical protein